MGVLHDLEDLLLGIQVKQSKYKYNLILEYSFNQKTKSLMRNYSLIKYHIEVIENDEGKNKRMRVQDKAVRGRVTDILLWLVDDYKKVVDQDE